MLKRTFELCGGFKLYKKPLPVPTAKPELDPSSVMAEVHKRATRRLILCLDGFLQYFFDVLMMFRDVVQRCCNDKAS